MKRIKYPRTKNLPFSRSDSSDDVWWKNCSHFENKEVVVSEKLDGEATTIYPDGYVHARSVDSAHHPSRSWIKAFASQFAHRIPSDWRICGENLYAWHSIYYEELPTYFFVYGIYDENNFCISWEETESVCEELGLHTAPVIYRGVWDEKKIRDLWTGSSRFTTFLLHLTESVEDGEFTLPCGAEGFVVRLAERFHYDDFQFSCAKFVNSLFRQNMRDVHWQTAEVIPNKLALQTPNMGL